MKISIKRFENRESTADFYFIYILLSPNINTMCTTLLFACPNPDYNINK